MYRIQRPILCIEQDDDLKDLRLGEIGRSYEENVCCASESGNRDSVKPSKELEKTPQTDGRLSHEEFQPSKTCPEFYQRLFRVL
jgi:hypothetical protein